ncbi:MAG: heparinase II/III family protein [Oscillospiraceae bacterium]|nr:heparinase II/III family protein [Oscillospiraceae bacterium]
MKKIISFILAVLLLLGCASPAFGTETRTVSASGIFEKLDLSKMPAVREAVLEGDETLAKEELLKYYTEKFAQAEPQPGSEIKNAMVYLACKNTFAFSEPYLGYTDVKTTSYNKYTINLVGNKSGNYVLSMLDKTAGEILVASRENPSKMPQLLIICKDGTSKRLSPIADTYVRGGTYGTANYGASGILYAHDDHVGYTPYGDHTKRIYLRFDTTQIPSNADSVKLEFYAKISGGTESSLRLQAFAAYSTTWTESGITWNELLKNNAIGHFSWNDIPGGFNWVTPEGVPSQWMAYNGRFYEVTSLVQTALKQGKASANYETYMLTAKNLMLDFIQDAGAGSPGAGEDLDPANRLLEFPYIYKHLLADGWITAEENVSLLTWVWEETEFLSKESYLFSSTNQALSDLVLYHGFRHLTGFYQGGGFFPEFLAAESWRSNYAARQELVLYSMVLEDGAYNTISFGYPSEMVNCGVVLLAAMKEAGDNATAYVVKTRLVKLAKYLVDCTQPDGSLPYWGQGAPSDTASVVRTVLEAIGDTLDGDPTVAELRRFLGEAEGTELATVARFDISKIVVDRSGWEQEDTMLFMNAKNGGNHGHRDALALLLYYEGRQLLTDTGMTSYDSAHAHFNWQNSTTRSHNTVEVDGKAQTWYQNLEDVTHMGDISITANSGLSTIRAWSDANNKDISTKSLSMEGVLNQRDYHSTDFRHYRDVSFVKALGDLVIVTDKIVPEDSASHSYTQNWHFAPYSNVTVDSNGTGRTNYDKGPNLTITQAADAVATVRSGYDATAANTRTKYLEYKQTVTGTATYQTVLYPVSASASATVTTAKLNMSNTEDETALAMEISVSDSGKPELAKVYHYHSFEENPTDRSFGCYATDGTTGVLALNPKGETTFAALANGSYLNKDGNCVLSVSASVTDLSAKLEGTTLVLEGSDPKLSFLQICGNFSGQRVTTVVLNGEEVPFRLDSAGTVTLGGAYLLTHFQEKDLFTEEELWTASLSTVSVDTDNGVLKGEISGHDPFVYTNRVPEYQIQNGDVVELRIKNSILSGTYTALQVFYMTDSDTGFSSSKCMGHSASAYPGEEYVTVRLSFPKTVAGQTLTALRVDMVGSVKTDPAQGTYSIDYLYVGPAQQAPSATEGKLFFGFTNTTEDRLRYTGKNYGDRNYDEGFWVVNTKRCMTPLFDGEHMILELAETTDNYSATGVAPFVQTGDETLALANAALDYSPKSGDYLQVRFAMYNCDVVSGNPAIRLYFNTDGGGAMADKVTKNLSVSDLTSGEFMVVTVPMSESEVYGKTERLRGLRLNFPNVCSAKGKTGVIVVDYIYVGSMEELPTKTCTLTFRNYDGSLLGTQEHKIGETAVYKGQNPTRAYNEKQHYSFLGWDKSLSAVMADTSFTARYTATAHSYSYIQTDGQTHVASCSCGYSKTEAHGYSDGLCACGEEEVKEPVEESNWKLSHTLNLASDISVSFVVHESVLTGFDMNTVYVDSTIDTYEGNECTGTKTFRLEPVKNGSLYYFTLTGLTAVHMNDSIASVLYGTKEGQEYFSATDVYSIATYAYAQLDKAYSSLPLKTLCAELLRYGSLAQIYKGYRTEALADAQMTEEHKALLEELEAVTFGNVNLTGAEMEDPTITWIGKSLDLNSKVTVLYVINTTDYQGNVADLSLKVSYLNRKGEALTVTLERPKVYGNSGVTYAFHMDRLLAAELRTVLTARVYEGDQPLSNSLTYSADTYGNHKTGALGELCKGLFAYSDAAKAYFAS